MSNPSLIIAFFAGLLTFFTPCFLPLIPAYLSFISGLSFDQLSAPKRPKKAILINTIMFILGFSLVFVLMGASITYLGGLLEKYDDWLRKIGGVIIICFGLYLIGIFKLTFLNREKKIHLRSKPAGLVGSIIVGAAFAAGWTPCVGPILGSILVYAGTRETVSLGIRLLIVYSLGLGVPFILSALLIDIFLKRLNRISRYVRIVSVFCGIFLLLIGVLLFTDSFKNFGRF